MHANLTRGRFQFHRERLPSPTEYYHQQGVELRGGGEWRDAICCFHKDTKPSLRIKISTGSFRCMVCSAKGQDILSFHRLKYGLGFIEAAKQLGAGGE